MAASKASTPAKARPAASRKGRIDADQLTGLFPGSLGDWHLLTLAKPLPSPVPGPRPAVEAEYGKGNDEAQLSISNDLPSAAGKGQRTVHDEVRPDLRETVVTMGLGNGLVVTAASRTADVAALKALIESMNLAKAEGLRPAKR
jgi:hypothetical protein